MKPITDPVEHEKLAHEIMTSSSWDEAAGRLERYRARVEKPYVDALSEIKRLFIAKACIRQQDIVALLESVGMIDEDVERVDAELTAFKKSCNEDFP